MDLEGLDYFVKVADSASLSAAAALYRLPKSSLSFKLRQLEKDFGVKLFERDGHTLVLTDAGSELLKQARQILSSCNAVSEQMSELRDHVAGTLHLAHTGEFGTAFSGQLLLAFRQRFPRIKVDLVIYEPSSLWTPDRLRGFDAVLSWDQDMQDEHFVRPLTSVTFGLFASPSFLKSTRPISRIDDIAMLNGMLYSRPAGIQLWRLINGGQKVDLLPQSAFRANDFWTIKFMTVAGEGLAYLPQFFTEVECRRGTLQPVLPEWQSEPWWINLRVPRSSLASKKVSAFVEFCASYVNPAMQYSGPRFYVETESDPRPRAKKRGRSRRAPQLG